MLAGRLCQADLRENVDERAVDGPRVVASERWSLVSARVSPVGAPG
jgi:hypothetical protein